MIFLVGYRGTGKTTIARLLAERLGWNWLDADAVLEERHQRRITEVFAQDGEAVFRDMESAVLADLCKLSRHVIATGGGVVLREENRRQMRETGRVVWLTASVETIWTRLQADVAAGRQRPALTVGGQAEIVQLLGVREPHYRACAHLRVATDGRMPEEIAEEIARTLVDQLEARATEFP
jgi:shikimate kinase